jgi:hypothetical protein
MPSQFKKVLATDAIAQSDFNKKIWDDTDKILDVGGVAVQIRSQFPLWTGIEALMESCRSFSGNQNLHVDDASKENSILTDS